MLLELSDRSQRSRKTAGRQKGLREEQRGEWGLCGVKGKQAVASGRLQKASRESSEGSGEKVGESDSKGEKAGRSEETETEREQERKRAEPSGLGTKKIKRDLGN